MFPFSSHINMPKYQSFLESKHQIVLYEIAKNCGIDYRVSGYLDRNPIVKLQTLFQQSIDIITMILTYIPILMIISTPLTTINKGTN
jgi:hypothetical protein